MYYTLIRYSWILKYADCVTPTQIKCQLQDFVTSDYFHGRWLPAHISFGVDRCLLTMKWMPASKDSNESQWTCHIWSIAPVSTRISRDSFANIRSVALCNINTLVTQTLSHMNIYGYVLTNEYTYIIKYDAIIWNNVKMRVHYIIHHHEHFCKDGFLRKNTDEHNDMYKRTD